LKDEEAEQKDDRPAHHEEGHKKTPSLFVSN
jgi:hypothetical protein